MNATKKYSIILNLKTEKGELNEFKRVESSCS